MSGSNRSAIPGSTTEFSNIRISTPADNLFSGEFLRPEADSLVTPISPSDQPRLVPDPFVPLSFESDFPFVDFSAAEPLGVVTPPSDALEHGSNIKPMTPGQASLFAALFSLGQPEEYQGMPQSHITSLPSPESDRGEEHDEYDEFNDPEDTENVAGIISGTLALDRTVKSNSVPFILQCCESKLLFISCSEFCRCFVDEALSF